MNKPKQERELFPVEPDVLRFRLATMFPHFNSITYRIRPKLEKDLHTFGVSPNWIWYYGERVPMNQDEQVAALFHELNHLMRDHAGRQNDREHKKWNWAGDFEINDWWPRTLTPPDWILKPADYNLPDGELAEWYFSNMPEVEYHVREDANSVDPGTGKCTKDGCDSQDVTPVAGTKEGGAPVKGKFHGPKCGAVSRNGDNSNNQDNDAEPAVGEYEAEAIRHQVAKELVAEASKGRGNIPGGMLEWAKQLLDPQVPWQKLLRTAVRRATVQISGQRDHTWNRQGRRTIKPFIMPKRIDHSVIPAFYVDTSGSMSDDEVNQALTEVRSATKATAGFMYVSMVDAQVQNTVKISNASEMSKVHVAGRGGTDMTKCFEHFETLKPRPNLIVIITDGETPWPELQPRNTKTIVVLTQEQPRYTAVPEWAEVVVVDPKGKD